MLDLCLNFSIKNIVVSLFTIYITKGVTQITLLNLDIHSKSKFKIYTIFEFYFMPNIVCTVKIFNKLFTLKEFMEKK